MLFATFIASEEKIFIDEMSKKRLKFRMANVTIKLLFYTVFWQYCRRYRMADYKVKVNYKPLWKMLIDREISKAELRDMTKIAASTFTKMTNNEYVALDILVRIAIALDCGIDDIVEIER